MGYYSTLSGELTIVPSLTHSEIGRLAQQPYRPGSREGADASVLGGRWAPFTLDISEQVTEEDGPDGTVTRRVRTASVITPNDESAKWYSVEEDLQWLVATIGPGHVFRGEIEVQGEEADDLWRMVVRGGKVVRQDSIRSWPDAPADDATPGGES